MQNNTIQKLNVPEKHLPVKPLTKSELHTTAKERIEIISKEFEEGFRFIEKYPTSVTFFGSARFTEENTYYKLARSIAGRIVKELGYSILSGGGPGIMEAANRGASENGGQSLGLSIELPNGQALNPYVNESIDFYYFFIRKVCLSFSAEAYLFFPGGFGTLDEVFEILTLVQTHKIEKVPVILVGADYWRALEETLKKELLGRGTIDEADMALYTITDDENEILNIIKNSPVRNGLPFTPPEKEKHILADKKCVPCEGDTKPLSHNASDEYLEQVNQWTMVDDVSIEKTLHLKTFSEIMNLVNKIAKIAEEEKHHPDLHIFDYNKLRIVLSTHAIKGLSENDFILAAKIDQLLRDQ
jgi:uncharacterized protein (TIGR00730 family)